MSFSTMPEQSIKLHTVVPSIFTSALLLMTFTEIIKIYKSTKNKYITNDYKLQSLQFNVIILLNLNRICS